MSRKDELRTQRLNTVINNTSKRQEKRLVDSLEVLEKELSEKQTTKLCPICGNRQLILLTTHNMKVCTDHKEYVRIPWHLGENQKPLFSGAGGMLSSVRDSLWFQYSWGQSVL